MPMSLCRLPFFFTPDWTALLPYIRRSIAALAAAMLLSGCANRTGCQWPAGFAAVEIPTSTFTLAARVKMLAPGEPMRIYIEGDGYAFNAHGRPSSDPTPRETTLRDLVMGDPHPNVAYLARPCQYIRDARCTRRYWSTARFSPEVIAALSEAAARISAGRPATLIGYSGGAQAAGLIAATNPSLSVRKIVTIAGNLDHPNWCRIMGLPPLKESMDLTRYWDRFQAIPQIHFVGEDDEVVPPQLTLARIQNPDEVVILPGVAHNKGWMRFAELIWAQ